MNKTILTEIKKISPTFNEYFEAKRVVEKYEKEPKYDKKFYVQQGFGFFSVGTFGGWDKYGNFMLKVEDVEPYSHIKDTHYVCAPIEDVFEKKQKSMKKLNAGIE